MAVRTSCAAGCTEPSLYLVHGRDKDPVSPLKIAASRLHDLCGSDTVRELTISRGSRGVMLRLADDEQRRRRAGRIVFLLVGAVVSAAVGYGVTAGLSAPKLSPGAIRSELELDLRELGAISVNVAKLQPYVQGVDASLVAAMTKGFTSNTDGSPIFLPGALTVSTVSVNGPVVVVDLSAANSYGQDRFAATGVFDGGRWKVSWVTVCMLIEQEGVLCPNPPPGVGATVPLPYSITDHDHQAGQTRGLLEPESLAIAADGALLIVDASRDQVLRRRANGSLSVVAGDGFVGFSGDGGPASRAELDLGHGAGIAVARDGTIYLADPGNCRLRAIDPSGIIRTVSDAGVLCGIGDVAVSPGGVPYVTTQGDVDKVLPTGAVVLVAGGGREDVSSEGPKFTPQTIDFSPESLAFDGAGDLDIWSFEPRAIFRLTPTGALSEVGGFEYATALTSSPSGTVFIAGFHGGIFRVASSGIEPYDALSASRISGLPWASTRAGFQADGIAVASSGEMFVDNDPGNGVGDGTVLVAVDPHGAASVVPLSSPLTDTLPAVGAPGFPLSEYPPARGARGHDLSACPSSEGLEAFDSSTTLLGEGIAAELNSKSLVLDLQGADRAWWQGDFTSLQSDDDGGAHSVLSVVPASADTFSNAVATACGEALVRESLVVDIGASDYSGEISHLYLLDRYGHPLVYFQAS